MVLPQTKYTCTMKELINAERVDFRSSQISVKGGATCLKYVRSKSFQLHFSITLFLLNVFPNKSMYCLG